jgi:hypothetical protein
MRTEDIEELLSREPFLPFRIFLTNGDHFDVSRRHSIATGRNMLFIVLPDDRWKYIPLRHIASVETLQAA